jgi:hypothetical protein
MALERSGAKMRGPELRQLRSQLASAEDSKIHLVLQLLIVSKCEATLMP